MRKRLICLIVFFIFPLYAAVESEIEVRWQKFQEGRSFAPFKMGLSDAVLEEQFKEISKRRREVWETEEFAFAQNLIENDLIRAPGCIAFAFNNTVPYYNASTICVNGRTFIACEGPRSKDVASFFKMLETCQVHHLVRLTGSFEGWTKKCHPYWEDLTTTHGNETVLDVPRVTIFHMDYWQDHSGTNTQQLLDVVLEVRALEGLPLIHCSAGVGRTGTFMASMLIVDAIDRGEEFSIEEIVYRLSLQRVHSVAKPPQYVTLHRLAELYLQSGLS